MEAPDVPRELDMHSIVEYLTHHYVVSPRTVLSEVRKLPPGHWARIDREGAFDQREWYAPRFRPARTLRLRSRASRAEEFDHLFMQACERCLIGDVPVGLLLSDGIDSNSIAASLARR